MSKNLIIRTSVAAVAIPIILTICYTGGYWYFGMISVFALAATCEFLLNEGYRPKNITFWLTLAFVDLCLWFAGSPDWYPCVGFDRLGPLLIFFFLVSGMATAMGRSNPSELMQKQTRLFWGVTYLGMLYPFVLALGSGSRFELKIGRLPSGDLLLFLFALLWVGDTCAMGFGKWLGKHKLAPGVSPNKTVEGFIGGIVGAMLIGVLMHFWKFPNIPFPHMMAISIGCSVFGQLGDLVESMWKRSLGIKDSSAIIPGHGGVLDRFDSLLFAAPFMFAYLSLFPIV